MVLGLQGGGRLFPARWRRYSGLILAVLTAAVLAAAVYFLKVDPLWGRIKKGLDIQGGIHVVFEGRDVPGMPVTGRAMEQARNIIEQRVNALGVAEPVIQRQGERRIIVELPGIRDPEKALEAIGRTALLEFKDSEGKVIVTGKDLVTRAVGWEIDPNRPNEWVVTLQFRGEGSRRFAEATRKAVGFPEGDPRRNIGIYLDGRLIQSPMVRESIENGRAVITGYTNQDEAKRVAVSLQSGALPVKLDMIENRIISPTLGKDSLQKSETAAVIGFAAVAAYMLLWYRVPGLWAAWSLAAYLLLMMAALLAIKATVTLPGIVGFVLSLGMAVDANVITYERVKDELQTGKTIRAALDAGFANAWRAIFDSNATTILGAVILFWLGTGPVRGFALVLGIGILLSMFTAITLTRFVLRLLVNVGLRPGFLFFARQGGAAVRA